MRDTSTKLRVSLAGLILVGVVAAPAAAAEEQKKKATDDCAKLPATISLDAGKQSLTRADGRWILDSKKAARPDSLTYYDANDNRRVYRFKRWTGDEYSCSDTGRWAK
ncbi:hypothetical protein GCM10025771_23860 [Niveibacterium umoris]|uniref:Uncharacterized protein n=1 Tax=Niveibacterium umoris TaxID=1193620 RepID=A0A840BNK7_9RHOO|nr:hypothetical protein [Niveibacterium umoris]MBB4012426.1 hypothetical protein [Niveibacterium umoris]